MRAALTETAAGSPPRHAAFAVAAPAIGDGVEMTNHPGTFSREAVRRALDRLAVVNDFAAVALSVPLLDDNERRKLGGGAAAGNLALTLGAGGGVYIAAGIVPALDTAFAQDRFRRRFEAKGRFAAYLATIPTYII